ncbi:MAG: PDDEXK nuclease domain-containing protein [Verrucomicrobia bacterium]|nr:PDDEXK nuclease domain-containing protein [Verrucomicrobiota bacterium]
MKVWSAVGSAAPHRRDRYVLEFTGLSERPEYSEDELESALLDHLQHFFLELDRGFCFEARQFRMTEGRKHHHVDLVFYHRILRCHVLIDLKIRAFKPEDAGQMNFYVNWFKTNMMHDDDNPPVGILLCSDRDGTEVEFATAGMDQKLFVSRYLVALPSAEKLRNFLEADRELIERWISGGPCLVEECLANCLGGMGGTILESPF